MLSVTEAQQIILQQAMPLAARTAPISSSTLGLVLAEDIVSDLDSPPFDKALMDGFAFRSDDLKDGLATLTVVEEIVAGKLPEKEIGMGQAARIMTGAAIPNGADTVVPIERTQINENTVTIANENIKSGDNILLKAREMAMGQVVLPAGTRLGPQEFGLAASVGRTAAKIVPAPIVAILSTGDEIVEPYLKPGPGQIRNSNGPMLSAQVMRAGAVPKFLGIAPDCPDRLTSMIGDGLAANILVLSGGVSAGKMDLVPDVLQKLGVQQHFHKVAMKPGKPVLFGTRNSTLVFGLPGNPVSSMVCFELFVRPAIRKLENQKTILPTSLKARLENDINHRSDRPTYHPCQLRYENGEYHVRLNAWFGSADLRGLTKANAFALLPAGEVQFKAGDILEILPTEWQ